MTKPERQALITAVQAEIVEARQKADEAGIAAMRKAFFRGIDPRQQRKKRGQR